MNYVTYEMPFIAVPAFPDSKPAGDESPGEMLHKLILAAVEKKKLPYGLAFAEVQREHPELTTAYAEELRAE